jgi:hypothetical protein
LTRRAAGAEQATRAAPPPEDPDGDGWLLQKVTARLPGCVDDYIVNEQAGQELPA